MIDYTPTRVRSMYVLNVPGGPYAEYVYDRKTATHCNVAIRLTPDDPRDTESLLGMLRTHCRQRAWADVIMADSRRRSA